MSATRKKVIVRLQDGKLHWGYLPDQAITTSGEINLLLPNGKALTIAVAVVHYVAFVRDFNTDDLIDPERMGFRHFSARPRANGLWVRVHFSEGDVLEGFIHEGGLAFLDVLLMDHGVLIEPPNLRGNTHRLFIPRSAMTKFEILSVTGGALAAKRRGASVTQRQGDLFDPTSG